MDENQPEIPPVQFQQPEPKAPSTLDHIVPAKNPPALIGYYLAVFSLIPCLALILGPAAVYFGSKGRKAARETPSLPGRTHAMFAIAFGALMTLVNIAAVGLLIFYSQQKS